MKSKRKILILSNNDTNGAGDAMAKLAEVLISMSHDVIMVVKEKSSLSNFILPYTDTRFKSKIKKQLDRVRRRIPFIRSVNSLRTEHKYLFFSIDESKENIVATEFLKNINFYPDYIFVGLTYGFLNSTDIRNLALAAKAKVYNLTVDMNHFTGGCHYSWGCSGFTTGCHNCPAIVDPKFKFIASRNFKIKADNAYRANFQILAGSGLTVQQAKESLIYKSQSEFLNVNSLIDTSIMNPNNRGGAKVIFNFSEDKFYIMAGAYYINDERKGFRYLLEALELLSQSLKEEDRAKVVLVVVAKFQDQSIFQNIKFHKEYVSFVRDYRLLAQLYQAVDLFVNTSIEDAGPMMVSEALACGTPVVGFDTGVVMNMVIDGYNGFKANVGDSEQLMLGIKKIVELTDQERKVYSRNAVKQVEEWSSYEYARNIFEKILN